MRTFTKLAASVIIAATTATTAGMTSASADRDPSAGSAASSCTAQPGGVCVTLPDLQKGDSGHAVLLLQTALIRKGYTYLHGTGYYGDNTAKAVGDWDAAHGNGSTAEVHQATWDSLIDSWSVPNLDNPQLSPGQPMTADAATALQILVADQEYLTWLPVTAAPQVGTPYTGVYVELVKALQQRIGVPDSGVFGVRTLKAIQLLYMADCHCS